ncbi:hypothetical protein [Paenibacillus sp. O199]|uniref:hypothetical protein n=1 Tax=Paenibacillus sp. O199 TaxID=1643925 RepID=UPI0007BF3538|nr:hypothetical protein [Paenibacillus sp. O199]
MFRKMTNVEIRELSRTTVESLEMWIRRLIDSQMRSEYGESYIYFQKSSGDYIVKKTVREKVRMRREMEPDRFPRDIDALDLDNAK